MYPASRIKYMLKSIKYHSDVLGMYAYNLCFMLHLIKSRIGQNYYRRIEVDRNGKYASYVTNKYEA